MNILQASPPRQNSSRTSNFTLNANQFKPNNGSDNPFSNELFLNLKRNYEERYRGRVLKRINNLPLDCRNWRVI